MKLVMFMTIVFTVSDNVKNRMISFYADKRRQKTPPYAIFQADDADTNITLYNSESCFSRKQCRYRGSNLERFRDEFK